MLANLALSVLLPALSAAAAPAQPPFEGNCIFVRDPAEGTPFKEGKFRLDEEHDSQELHREGGAVYLARLFKFRNEGKPTEYFFSLRVEDPARSLKVSATRPAGNLTGDQLQLNPGVDLPSVICGPVND